MNLVALATNAVNWSIEEVAAAAAVASAVAAVIALLSGMNANRIANAAAKRDEDRILREKLKVAQDERRSVAAAMLDFLEAFVVWAETAPGTGSASELPAKQEFRRLKVIAYREIALYTGEDMTPVRARFNEELGRISNLARQSADRLSEIDKIANSLRVWISDWNAGPQASEAVGK
ncbi:hypothetical protein ACFWHR_07555 [Leucobacter sp. NPDC058333]|uniref:hypothetical protein n=1 Tax=Leucobacter sp. NPDC058333 TaxID=3346450 RepID=UPI0036596E26